MRRHLTVSDVACFLGEHDHFLILSHRRPDGDTIGSSAALCLGLRALGKTAHVLENPEITHKYRHLHAGLSEQEAQPEHLVVCVDTASPSLLTQAGQALLPRLQLRIDHHGSSESFAPMELVDPGASSCGDLIYDILRNLGIKPDKAMAEALYTAVSTDTGCFRYANTNSHAYLVAAACADAGGDLHTINQLIFDTNSFARLRLQSWMVENIRFYKNGSLAVCALPRAVEQQLQLTEDDLENVSGFPRSIEGVQVAATLREMEDGQVKMSVRALPGFDATLVCSRFGGGGHKGAAGATVPLPLQEAARAVAQIMEELF